MAKVGILIVRQDAVDMKFSSIGGDRFVTMADLSTARYISNPGWVTAKAITSTSGSTGLYRKKHTF